MAEEGDLYHIRMISLGGVDIPQKCLLQQNVRFGHAPENHADMMVLPRGNNIRFIQNYENYPKYIFSLHSPLLRSINDWPDL